MRIYLAIGSNVGDTFKYIDIAIDELSAEIDDIKRSKLYLTKPFGVVDQDNFINCAISGEADMSPSELLKYVKNIELDMGRTVAKKWGPREIDIDIIFYGDEQLDLDELTIPHSQYRTRDFVLKPLLDLSPDIYDPVSGIKLSEMLEAIPKDQATILKAVN